MNIIVRVCVIAMALFFAIGGYFAWYGSLKSDTYIIVTGLIGSVASVIGLVALAAPRLTTKDIRDVEADLVKELSTTMQAVRDYEAQASASKKEIDRLAQQRAEIELLVRQASLKAFMEERLRYIASELDKKLDADNILTDLIFEYKTVLDKVTEIDGKIERSERADLIQEVLLKVGPRFRKEIPPRIVVEFMETSMDIGPAIAALSRLWRGCFNIINRMIRG